MIEKNIKPIVLMLIEGWGLSANWRGNAIASADTSNFHRYWNSYYHLVLRANLPSEATIAQDPFSNYHCISAGKRISDPHSFILDNIVKQDKTGTRLFKNSADRNSAVHLIGSISKNSEFGDQKVLDALIRLAKEQKVFRLYLHILIDDTYNKDKKLFLNRITELEQLISQYDLGEIATIGGLSVSSQEESVQDYILLLSKGIGERYMDASQAINHCTDPLENMKPAILTDSKDALIKDFDTIIFFNHQLSGSEAIINQLAVADNHSAKNGLNFTEVWTLVSFPTIFSKKINFLFQINKEESLAAVMNGSETKSFFISEADRSAQLNFYFDAGNFSKDILIQSNNNGSYLLQWRKIVDATNTRILDAVNSSEYKLIIGNYSVLPKLCRFGSFNNVVQGVNKLDQSMLKLADQVLKQDGILFIASPYGLAEKAESGYGRQGISLNSSDNPVPLIVIANNSQISNYRKDVPKESVNELISPRKNLTTIHRLLLLLISKKGFVL